jgi:hypothetical protein
MGPAAAHAPKDVCSDATGEHAMQRSLLGCNAAHAMQPCALHKREPRDPNADQTHKQTNKRTNKARQPWWFCAAAHSNEQSGPVPPIAYSVGCCSYSIAHAEVAAVRHSGSSPYPALRVLTLGLHGRALRVREYL